MPIPAFQLMAVDPLQPMRPSGCPEHHSSMVNRGGLRLGRPAQHANGSQGEGATTRAIQHNGVVGGGHANKLLQHLTVGRRPAMGGRSPLVLTTVASDAARVAWPTRHLETAQGRPQATGGHIPQALAQGCSLPGPVHAQPNQGGVGIQRTRGATVRKSGIRSLH